MTVSDLYHSANETVSERTPIHSFAPRGEYQISVTDWPGLEPAIVFLHGFPDNCHLWDRVIPFLSERRVVTFDFLGWGKSDKPQDHDYTFAGQLEDISAVVDHLGLEKIELVGHDSGMPGALDWTLDHPERVSAVTLMNGFYLSADGVRPPAVISILAFGQMDPNFPLGLLPAGISGGMDALGFGFMEDANLFSTVMRWQQRRFFARAEDADHFMPLFMAQFEGPQNSIRPLRSLIAKTFQSVAMHVSRVDDLRGLEVPVNFVWGGLDEDLKVAAAELIMGLVPKSRLTVFEHASHNVPIDEAAGVAELLLDASTISGRS